MTQMAKKGMINSDHQSAYDIIDTALIDIDSNGEEIVNIIYGPILSLDMLAIGTEIHVLSGYNTIQVSNTVVTGSTSTLTISELNIL